MKKEELLIRESTRSDIPVLHTFQLAMAQETEGLILDSDTLKRGITAVFDHPEKGKYYVAEIDKNVVGSLMITYEWSDWRCRTIYWIQSVYVLPDYRRRGVYRALYGHVRNLAETNEDIGGIRLYVDSQNHTAQQTYSRLGMNGDHYKVFEWMRSF
ncbi:MAG TPA: GNAT family N-acetyltransferase [Bacteroidales bacterium]|nr:GNAT family N-acetyltransferase [Bacteroidales bacterium]